MRTPDWQSDDGAIQRDGRPVIIYALIDPKTRKVRYVGKTVDTLKRRIVEHINAARRGKKTHLWLFRWLLSLPAKPTGVVLEVVPPMGDWAARERRWIRRMKLHGCRLCNIADGGVGISGVKLRPEHKEKIAAAHRRGVFVPCAHCGVAVWRSPSREKSGDAKFCSKVCYFSWQRGRTKVMPKRGGIYAHA